MSHNIMRSISNVEAIIEQVRELFADQYPHLVCNTIANITYVESDTSATFEEIQFISNDSKEKLRVCLNRICLEASDGVRYKLLSYNSPVDLFHIDQEDIKKEPCGQTLQAKTYAETEEALKNDLICSLGTMLPNSNNLGFEQIEASADKIAKYLMAHGYMKENSV